MSDDRIALKALIEQHREDYTSISRLLGRNDAYIQQFIRRGTPRRLAEHDRRTLAEYFGVAEAVLGGPAAPPPSDLVQVPRLDVGASAGPGRETGAERVAGGIAFPRAMLRQMVPGSVDGISMIRVEGDSMEPTLSDGDEILVDRADAGDRLRDGIYVLRLDDRLMVKRISLARHRDRIAILSDNRHHPGWPDTALAEVTIIGRVIWAGRKVG